MATERELLQTKVAQEFSHEDPAAVRALLDAYGTESWEQERERVQLAILFLSRGDLHRMSDAIAVAKRDYRDVLAWAEYPTQMTLSATEMAALSPHERRRISEQDRARYVAWLNSAPDP
jgi:hypothetical protein